MSRKNNHAPQSLCGRRGNLSLPIHTPLTHTMKYEGYADRKNGMAYLVSRYDPN